MVRKTIVNGIVECIRKEGPSNVSEIVDFLNMHRHHGTSPAQIRCLIRSNHEKFETNGEKVKVIE